MSGKKKDADDDYGGDYLASDRQPENRVAMYVDADGYASRICGWYGMQFQAPDEAASMAFLAFIRKCRDRYPLDPADIVYGKDQQFDADGRPLTFVEMQHAANPKRRRRRAA